jgi:RecJ-like exonuclease
MLYPNNRFRKITCEQCGGTGYFFGYLCRKCHGLGYTFDLGTKLAQQQICSLCRGTRTVPEPFTGRPVPCPRCRGLGYSQ